METPEVRERSFSRSCSVCGSSTVVRAGMRSLCHKSHLSCVCLSLGVGALEVFDAVFVEDPEAGGYFVDQVVVVGD